MSGPWEKYQQPAAPEDGPWTKYGQAPAATPAPAAAAPEPNSDVIQEMHPDITFGDRFKIKNFGSSNPADAVNYLRTKHPGMDVQVRGGQVIAKNPGEKNYKVLDPEGFDLQDITDVATDLGTGALSGLASAGAGLAAGASSLGIGAIPAAAAAGGATSAGLEAARQGLGKFFGVRPDYSGSDIALSGVTGAAAPVLFGTGATAAQQAAKLEAPGAVSSILSKIGAPYIGEAVPTAGEKTLAASALKESQSGLLHDLPYKFLSAFGGKPKDTLKAAMEEASPELIAKLGQNGISLDPNKTYRMLDLIEPLKQQGISNLGEAASSEILGAIKSQNLALQEKFETALAHSDQTIDLAPLKTELESYIESLRKAQKAKPIEAVQKELDAATNFVNEYLTPTNAKTSTGLEYINPDTMERIAGKTLTTRQGPRGAPINVPLSSAMKVKNAVSEFIDFSQSPLVTDKMGAASKTLRAKAQAVAARLSDEVYGKLDNPELRGLWAENQDLMRTLYPKFKDEATGLKTIQNLGSPANRVLREKLAGLDKSRGTKTLELSKMADVFNHFSDAPLEHISSGGATSTGKYLRGGTIGGVIGGGIGTMMGNPYAGMVIGGALGTQASSPAAVKMGLKGAAGTANLLESLSSRFTNTKTARDIVDAIAAAKNKIPANAQKFIPGPQVAAPVSAWNLMRGPQ